MIERIKSLFAGQGDTDMTRGNIWRHLIAFALPLLAGNIFQQLYNTVDSWVVGNYVSDNAFSAVGTVSPIINTLIGTFMGLSSGAGVVISQYYGAKREDKVQDAVHTSLTLTLILGAIFTVVGILFTPFMLELTNTPDAVKPESTTYLIIYFAGILGLMVYNMGAGILRAVGDSRHPFYYLVVSAVINTGLDLLFVLVFEMKVEGVALATVIAQGVSALLVVWQLMRSHSAIRLQWRKLKLKIDTLKQILKVGFPAALQMAITSFSNVFVQSYINGLGENVMGGWTAYTKIDQLIFLPMQSVSLASTTFVGQNLGCGQVDRAKKGIRTSIILGLLSTVITVIPVVIFAHPLTGFFNDNPAIVACGTLLLQCMSPFYVLCSINQILAGALRGAGNTRAPMLIMLGSFVVFRQIYLFIVSNYISNTLLPVAMGYPAGWLVATVVTLIYYKKASLAKTRLVKDADD